MPGTSVILFKYPNYFVRNFIILYSLHNLLKNVCHLIHINIYFEINITIKRINHLITIF